MVHCRRFWRSKLTRYRKPTHGCSGLAMRPESRKQFAALKCFPEVCHERVLRIAWDTYDLQTDHYALAYFFSGGYYQNPLYFGDGSCDDASSDCTIGLGGGIFWVEVASIYVGSTLA